MLFKVQYQGKKKYIKLNGASHPAFLQEGNAHTPHNFTHCHTNVFALKIILTCVILLSYYRSEVSFKLDIRQIFAPNRCKIYKQEVYLV